MTKDISIEELGFSADAVSVYNAENPRAVINLLPVKLREMVEKLPEKYRYLDEKTARNMFRPSPAMNQIRAAFWVEYNVAQTVQRAKMEMVRVYAGIVSMEYFHDVVVNSQEMLAWMLIPPQQFQAILNEAWDAGMSRMREVLDLPFHDKKGNLSHTSITQVIKVFQLLDQRKHGSYVQKNVNMNLSGAQAQEAMLAMQGSTMESLDKRLSDLREKMERQSLKAPEIEVEKIE